MTPRRPPRVTRRGRRRRRRRVASIATLGGAVSAAVDGRSAAPALRSAARPQRPRRARLLPRPARIARRLRSLRRLARRADAPSTTAGPRPRQIAFWINAYNAFVIESVLDRYPIAGRSPAYPANSLRQVPGVFEKQVRRAAGRRLTLDDIEKSVLAGFGDPRVFLALGRGSVGGGRLRSSAFSSDTLEADLVKVAAECVTRHECASHRRVGAGAGGDGRLQLAGGGVRQGVRRRRAAGLSGPQPARAGDPARAGAALPAGRAADAGEERFRRPLHAVRLAAERPDRRAAPGSAVTPPAPTPITSGKAQTGARPGRPLLHSASSPDNGANGERRRGAARPLAADQRHPRRAGWSCRSASPPTRCSA